MYGRVFRRSAALLTTSSTYRLVCVFAGDVCWRQRPSNARRAPQLQEYSIDQRTYKERQQHIQVATCPSKDRRVHGGQLACAART